MSNLAMVVLIGLLPRLAFAESKMLNICGSKTYQVSVSVEAGRDDGQDKIVVILDDGVAARTFSSWINSGTAEESLRTGMNLANVSQQLDPLFLKISKTNGRLTYVNSRMSLHCDSF